MRNILEQIFKYEEHEVRTIERDGKMWWVLPDVCEILELSNTTSVAERLESDERSKFDLGRQGETWCVNEFGLYNVIMRSDKPEAKKFKHWVTHTVLPSVMRYRQYISPQRQKYNGRARYFYEKLKDFGCLYKEEDIVNEREKLVEYFNALVFEAGEEIQWTTK